MQLFAKSKKKFTEWAQSHLFETFQIVAMVAYCVAKYSAMIRQIFDIVSLASPEII